MPLPDELDPRGFSVRDGLRAGLTPDQLRARRLVAPHRGTRSTAVPSSVEERAHALAPLLTVGDRFSHTTAALLHGMRLPSGHREVAMHLTSTQRPRAPQIAGVAGHRSSVTETVTVDDLPVSSPVVAWVECSSILALDDLIVMGDGLVRRRRPQATMPRLSAAVEGHRGRRGFRSLEKALAHIRPGTGSARETELRLLVVRAGLPEPEVNGEIRNEFGVLLGHGDLVFRRERVLLEYEGRQHTDPRQFAIDIERLDVIMAESWRVMRVDRVLFADKHRLLSRLRAALTRPR